MGSNLRSKQSAILTVSDFRAAVSKQCGFPLQLKDTPPESEREILRCAPPFDAKAEHENDLRYESRVDYESWQYDGPAEREDA